MIEFGKSLRAAREAKGYTIGQLAELTRVAPMTLQELENEDFSHIAAPIYGRGFVKLYCEAVGLDPKPFIAEFTDILSGNRDLTIKERPIKEESPVEEAPSPEAPAGAPTSTAQSSVFDRPAPADENPMAKYAAPFHDTQHLAIRKVSWRITVLAIVSLAVLWAIITGLRALYRATSTAPDASATEAELQEEHPETPATPRTPQTIPPLYID